VALGERFAETSVQGALTRAAVAWVLITPAVAAAKIWWSGTAALVVFLVGVTIYIVVAVRYRRRHRPPPAT
jgi:membrane protein YdbS with pleckstrin-like domain